MAYNLVSRELNDDEINTIISALMSHAKSDSVAPECKAEAEKLQRMFSNADSVSVYYPEGK